MLKVEILGKIVRQKYLLKNIYLLEKEGGVEVKLCLREIIELSERYDVKVENNKRDKALTDKLQKIIFPSYEKKGFLTKNEFLSVCEWKTPRSKRLCSMNEEGEIIEISRIAKNTQSERIRIQIWLLLFGVGWPTASVFLHFGFPDQYPIIDFRALSSLDTSVPTQYNYDFWRQYVLKCREIAKTMGVSFRVLDKALWQKSFESNTPAILDNGGEE